MNQKKTIFRNVTALFISRVTAHILTFVIVVFIARYLGKSNFGIYAAAQSFVGLFVVLLSLGMEHGFVYKGTKDRSAVQWFLGSGILLKLILGILVMIIIMVAAKLLGYSLIQQNVILIFIFMWIFISFQNFFSGIFQIHQRMEFRAILDIGRELFFLLILMVVINLDLGLYATAGAKLLSNIVFFIVAFMLMLRFLKPNFKEIRIKGVLKDSYLFAFSGLFYHLYFQINTVLLSLMRTSTETGIYAAAFRLPVAAFLISAVVSTATRPAMFESEVSDRRALRKIYFLRSKYLAIFGLFAGISLLLLRDQVISLVYGAEYLQSAAVLSILAWFIPMRFMSTVSGDLITAVGQQKIRTIMQGATAAISVILSIVLIPRYGIFGAAWAAFCSEFFLLIVYTYIASKLFTRLPAIDTFLKPLIGALGMITIFLIAKGNWVVSYIFCFIVYWLILAIIGAFHNDPIVAAIKNKFLRM